MGRVKKTYRKKKKKSILKSRIFWIVFILISSTIFFVSLLLFNSFYQLEEVELKRINLTTESSLVNFVKRNSEKKFIFESSSLLFNSKFILKNKILNSYPHIEDVEIKKIFPDKLEIVVRERGEAAIWCKGKKINENYCYRIDDNGIAYQLVEFDADYFEIHQQTKGDISLGNRVLSEDKINFIFKVKEELEGSFKLEGMSIPYERSLFVKTEEGFEVKLDFKSDLKDQIERFNILLDEEIEEISDLEYIDLRYGNSVYYK